MTDYSKLIDGETWGRCLAVIPHRPRRERTGGREQAELRAIVAALAYRWRTGCGWEHLPPYLYGWQTVYRYYRGWLADGTAARLREILAPAGDVKGGDA